MVVAMVGLEPTVPKLRGRYHNRLTSNTFIHHFSHCIKCRNIFFSVGWVLRCAYTVKIKWCYSSFTGVRPRIPLHENAENKAQC